MIEGDATMRKNGPMERFAREDQLNAFVRRGYWPAMYTVRDTDQLEVPSTGARAPWMSW